LSTASPLRLELLPCPALAAAIVVAHAVAALCIVLVLPDATGVALAILVLALGAAAAWNRALLRGMRAPKAIEISPSAEARLVRADGRAAQARPLRGIGVTRWWVILRLGVPGRGGFLVSAGMLESEPFRLLRLWALWDRAPGVAPGQLQG
jgi:hypothetical protein